MDSISKEYDSVMVRPNDVYFGGGGGGGGGVTPGPELTGKSVQ